MANDTYLESLRKYVGHSPLLTVGVWMLIYNENNEVLMQLRTDFNSWDFPGGTIELSESIEETAKRELKEETNLDLDELIVRDIFSGEKTYRKYPNEDELYVVSVLCEVTKYHGHLSINDRESYELKWFKKEDIPNKLSPVTKNYIEKIKNYLK